MPATAAAAACTAARTAARAAAAAAGRPSEDGEGGKRGVAHGTVLVAAQTLQGHTDPPLVRLCMA